MQKVAACGIGMLHCTNAFARLEDVFPDHPRAKPLRASLRYVQFWQTPSFEEYLGTAAKSHDSAFACGSSRPFDDIRPTILLPHQRTFRIFETRALASFLARRTPLFLAAPLKTAASSKRGAVHIVFTARPGAARLALVDMRAVCAPRSAEGVISDEGARNQNAS